MKSKKYLIIIFLFILLTLFGCSNGVGNEGEDREEVYLFVGKSENWLATYTLLTANESGYDSLYIQHIGDRYQENISPIEYILGGNGMKAESQYPMELQGVRSFHVSGEYNKNVFNIKPTQEDTYILQITTAEGTEEMTLYRKY